MPGGLKHVTVDEDKVLWGVNGNNDVFSAKLGNGALDGAWTHF